MDRRRKSSLAIRRGTVFSELSPASLSVLEQAFLLLNPGASTDKLDDKPITVKQLRQFTQDRGHDFSLKHLRKVIRALSIDADYSTVSYAEFCCNMGEVAEGKSAEDVVDDFIEEHIINVATLFGAPMYVQMERDPNVPSWRVALARFADGTEMQVLSLVLIVLDVVCVGSELLLVYTKCEAPTRRWTSTEHTLHSASISVLLFFAGQITLCAIAYGRRFFQDFFQMFDAFIISFSLFMELVLHVKEGGLFVLLLSWRVVRIVHGLLTSAKLGTDATGTKVEEATQVAAGAHHAYLSELLQSLNAAHDASIANATDAKAGKQALEGAVKAIAADVEKEWKKLSHRQNQSRMKTGAPKSADHAKIGSAKSRTATTSALSSSASVGKGKRHVV